MSELHLGPHTDRTPQEPRHGEPGDLHPSVGPFDREIDLKAIAYTAIVLVVVTVAAHLLMLWLVKGLDSYGASKDAPPSPMEQVNVQPPPPEPRLQTTPEADLKAIRDEEVRFLAGIDAAMEQVAARGMGPEVVGGDPAAFQGMPATPSPDPGTVQPPSSQPLQPMQERR